MNHRPTWDTKPPDLSILFTPVNLPSIKPHQGCSFPLWWWELLGDPPGISPNPEQLPSLATKYLAPPPGPHLLQLLCSAPPGSRPQLTPSALPGQNSISSVQGLLLLRNSLAPPQKASYAGFMRVGCSLSVRVAGLLHAQDMAPFTRPCGLSAPELVPLHHNRPWCFLRALS